MLIKTRGIVLKSIKYSETSLIVDVLTEEKGLQTYIISGVRKKKSNVSASLLQVMSLVDMVAYHRDEKTMHRIKEIRPAYIFQQIPFDIIRSSIGLFVTELTRKTIKESEENQELFNFIFDNIKFLDQSPNSVGNLHIHFMLELTGFLGFNPTGIYSEERPFFDLQEGIFLEQKPLHPYSLDKDLSLIVSQMIHLSLEECHSIPMDRATRTMLLEQLIIYYRLHIENFHGLNSLEILTEVLA